MKERLIKEICTNPWFGRYYDFDKLDLIGLRDNKDRQDIYKKYSFSGMTVLDVGCNLGKNFIFLDALGPKKLIGIDMKITVGLAKQIAQLYDLKHTEYFHGDLNKKDWFKILSKKSGIHSYDYSLFVSVYGTKELYNRDTILKDLIKNTNKTVFFEGHHLDNHLDYSKILLSSGTNNFEFEGYTRDKQVNMTSGIRPFFVIHKEINSTNIIKNKIKTTITNEGRAIIGIEGLAGSGKTTFLKNIHSLLPQGLEVLIIDDRKDTKGNIYEVTNSLLQKIHYKLREIFIKKEYKKLSQAINNKKYDVVIVSDYRLREYLNYTDITIRITSSQRGKNLKNRNETIKDFPTKNITSTRFKTNNFYTLTHESIKN